MITASKRTTKTTAAKKTTKSTVKKTAVKKPTKKASSSTTAKAPNRNAIKTACTKTQILSGISDNTGLTKKEVTMVFSELEALIGQHLKKGGAGSFVLPGILKIMTKHRPATKARKGTNPFTGEPTVFKAKPARNVIKVRPLKKLKDMV